MMTINRQCVCDALRELASIEEQRRLWLSTGAGGANVSSFSEAVEQLYTDSGLAEAIDCDRVELAAGLREDLKSLRVLLNTVSQRQSGMHTIEDPAMPAVRLLANKLVRAMCAELPEKT